MGNDYKVSRDIFFSNMRRGFWQRVILRWHHLFFGLSLLSMIALLIWWTVFLNQSIEREHKLHTDNLVFRAKAHAHTLGHNLKQRPTPGISLTDSRLEILRCGDKQINSHAHPLLPLWRDYIIQPRTEHLNQLQHRFYRRKLMVIGEGLFLASLLVINLFMLYYLIRLEKKSARELQEFWGRLTHELKTPITGLKAFLQTLKTHDLNREELAQLTDLALVQVERQQQLAQNILVGQSLAKDTFALHIEKLDVVAFVREFVQYHRLVLAATPVSISLQCTERLNALADPGALHTIFDNLLDNAIKYGGPQLQLDFEIAANDRSAIVCVKDNGLGFEPHLAENLFDAYRRLSDDLPAGKHGTGMGLYISRSLARKMKGELVAYSEGRNKGSRFVLSLPLI
jgi:signal transduction histidine kinase